MIKINHKLKKYKNNSTKLMMRMINLLHYLSNKYKVVSLNRIIIMIIIKIRIIIIIIIIIMIIILIMIIMIITKLNPNRIISSNPWTKMKKLI